MAEFDAISKDLIQTYPQDFARFALAQDDVEVLEVLDTEQPTVETHRLDSLMRVRLNGTEVLVHNEFQTTDSTSLAMALRMAGYIGRLLEQYGLPVHSHVIYLRPAAGRHDRGAYVQDHLGYRVVIQYKVIRLSTLAGQAILDSDYTGLLPFAPLMQPPAGQTAAQWLRQCVQRAEAVPMAAATKANFLTDLAIMSGLVYDYQTIQRIIPEDIMYESSVIQHFAERGLEQGLEQGREQGLEQGREQGLEQGRERMLREDVQEVLELRFGVEQTRQLVDRIAAVDGVEPLRGLHRAAVQAADVAAFRSALESSTA